MNHFQPRHGTWVLEPTQIPSGGEMLRYRLSTCEEGYSLIRGQIDSYTRDKCDMCEVGKLALGQAMYEPVHEQRISSCLDCNQLTGVVCLGGKDVKPNADFWIDPVSLSLLLSFPFSFSLSFTLSLSLFLSHARSLSLLRARAFSKIGTYIHAYIHL